MNEQSKSHWQIKTVPITNANEDKLSHESIAELLDEKIKYLFDEDNIPSCICLNGEYGSGKSTIINLLFEKWKSASNKKVVHFNIWRHKEENTYYALFRNIFYALKNNNNKDFRQHDFIESITESDEVFDLDTQFSEMVYASFSKKRTNQDELNKGLSEFVEELPKYTYKLTKGLLKTLFIGSTIAAGIAGVIDFLFEQNLIGSVLFAFKVFVIAAASSSVFSILSKNIFKNLPTLFKFHVQPSELSISLPSITNTEQLQCVFRNILSDHRKKNDTSKLLIVIEDVDRKHNDEIIDTLNELRTFIDLGKAIFIIPCDLNNIERAFYDSAIDKASDIDEQYVRWKAKDFCSKIFSHTISLPPQGQQDLRTFLVNKINVESPKNPLKKLLEDESSFEQLIDILLVNSIKTPREAINIYNRFTLQIEHAIKLEKKSNRLNEGTISNHILQYARIYMLSTFYGFEKHLLRYPELPHWIIDNFRNRAEHYDLMKMEDNDLVVSLGGEIPEYAKNYFSELIKSGVLSLEVEEFVSRTEIYDSPLVKAFIYLDEVSYSGLLGNAIYDKVVRALKSRNIKVVLSLLEDDPKDTSILISKLLANVNYSSDFQSYVPSLIDIVPHVAPSNKRLIVNFVLEHFNRMTDVILYSFPVQNIENLFSTGNKPQVVIAKKRYFSVLSDAKESVSDYCSKEKVFEIVLMMVNGIDKDKEYVEDNLKELIKEITHIPVDIEIEYEQRKQLLNLTLDLEENTIVEIFSPNILNRLTTDLDDFYENFDELKDSMNRLISIFIKIDKTDVLNIINNISGYENAFLDEWFIELVQKYEDYFKEKDHLLKVNDSISNNIIVNYLTDSKYKENEQLIRDSMTVFSELDGYAFEKLETKNTPSFDVVLGLYKEIISSSTNNEFLSFIYIIIDAHEAQAHYNFINLLFDTIKEAIASNLIGQTIDTSEFSKSQITAEFLSRSDRLTKLKSEKANEIRDVVFPEFRKHIRSNSANNDQSRALFTFIDTLNSDAKFSDILCSWIENKNYAFSNGTPLTSYRDYLNVIELSLDKLSGDYLTMILSYCDYQVTNYLSDKEQTLNAWQWINKIADVNCDLNIFRTQLIPLIMNNYSNKDAYFSGKNVLPIVKFMEKFAPFEEVAEQNQYNDFFIWAMEQDVSLISFLSDKFGSFERDQKIQSINIINESDDWNEIIPVFIQNTSEIQEFVISLLTEQFNIEIIKKIYSKTSKDLDWSLISINAAGQLFESKYFSAGHYINKLNNEIIANFDVSEILTQFNDFLMELLRDNTTNKFLALDLIDKFELLVVPKSDLALTIKSELIDVCDINNTIDELSKIRSWIKKHNLTKSTGIINRYKEIKKVSDGEFSLKLNSIIKY